MMKGLCVARGNLRSQDKISGSRPFMRGFVREDRKIRRSAHRLVLVKPGR